MAKTGGYSYDNTNQLTGAEYNGFQGNEAYEYDANGNRVNNNFVVGVNNRLESDGTFSYVYDDEGNRVSRTRLSTAAAEDYKVEYKWDHRNRLVEVRWRNKSNSSRRCVYYHYDHLNRLVNRLGEPLGSPLIRERDVFVHDGFQIFARFYQYSSSDLDQWRLSNRYLWGAGQDELLADENGPVHGTVSSWVLCDHLGSVRDILTNGEVSDHVEYDSFGRITTALPATRVFRYTGKMYDDMSGLQWNINRWYDPEVGRWLSEDPIGFDGGDGNLYRYVGNAAIFNIDNLGLYCGAGIGGPGCTTSLPPAYIPTSHQDIPREKYEYYLSTFGKPQPHDQYSELSRLYPDLFPPDRRNESQDEGPTLKPVEPIPEPKPRKCCTVDIQSEVKISISSIQVAYIIYTFPVSSWNPFRPLGAVKKYWLMFNDLTAKDYGRECRCYWRYWQKCKKTCVDAKTGKTTERSYGQYGKSLGKTYGRVSLSSKSKLGEMSLQFNTCNCSYPMAAYDRSSIPNRLCDES